MTGEGLCQAFARLSEKALEALEDDGRATL